MIDTARGVLRGASFHPHVTNGSTMIYAAHWTPKEAGCASR
jgi:hypothetical protein